MSLEIEIKLRIQDLRSLRATLRRLRACPPGHGRLRRVHEMNVLFDTPHKDLARQGQLLRIRTESLWAPGVRSHSHESPRRVLLTFKSRASQSPRARHVVRRETELEVASAAALTQILESLGFKAWFRYEKYRTTYTLPPSVRWAKNLLIELDETPIGTFVEIEGPPAAIDRAARLLGFSSRDYLTATYLQLYLDDCRRRRARPGHMLFPKSI